jgi:hypothetical protein
VKQKQIESIVEQVTKQFRTFGGGVIGDPNNPISHWTKDEPAQFAAGVNVREVVECVVKLAEKRNRGGGK